MAARAQPSGHRLTEADASVVKGMVKRGDRHHDIAAWFGVNQGRIAEVISGHQFLTATEAPSATLPPPGPYSSGRAAHKAVTALNDAKTALQDALDNIQKALDEIQK
jgi:hypothetical protein